MSTQEQYHEQHQAEIDRWNAKIEELDAKIQEVGAYAEEKGSYEEQMNALCQQRDEIKAKLTELQNAHHEDRWKDLKGRLEYTWTHIKDRLGKITARFTS
jgi:uncharacterized coiled-coil DUF342 family protein